ncbi:NAD-dependent epimerase/dehydratase family protein [Sphingobium indicum]|uniref:NAD-dependent epimerase/dehydratase family protein n=1 Tax=Sphingobium indicum TaxID=332055 RepID=UPI00055A67F2|nr:NAD-dependent epimerase/dehydratase family protein [Sphingobium indicum]
MRDDRHLIVAGASGLVGRAAVEHFAGAGWRVTAVSRRPVDYPDSVKPLALDLADKDACRAKLRALRTTHIIYAALQEEAQLVDGWTGDAHVERNATMLTNLVESLDEPGTALRRVILVQGPKAYGVHVGPTDIPAREGQSERRDVPNFYWAQEDWLRARRQGRAWNWTVFRPGGVTGQAMGSPMNLIAAVGVYAAFLKDRGEPLHYPGTGDFILQPTDTRLMAEAFEWGFGKVETEDQVFNVTNGEVVSMRTAWPAIARALGMEVGNDRPIQFAKSFLGRDEEWAALCKRYGMANADLAQLVGNSFQFADFCFTLGAGTAPRGLMSTVKLRKAGFTPALAADEMYAYWFARYRADGMLPDV